MKGEHWSLATCRGAGLAVLGVGRQILGGSLVLLERLDGVGITW